MNQDWFTSTVALKFMLSDFVLWQKELELKVLPREFISPDLRAESLELPEVRLQGKEQGYLMRSLPLPKVQPVYRLDKEYIVYTPDQFNRYYIDLQQSFEDYTAKFSSKTRSTIKRKIKKFSKMCNGDMHWKCYKTGDELSDFHALARQVSSKSYQEVLLDSGLPDTQEFKMKMMSLAKEGLVRAYLLFHDDRPIAYLYCPAKNGVLLYQYLGYDPEYLKWSVGTILHWYAFEDIFSEASFRLFDFTEGQSEHKRLFSTASILCGNVYVLPKKLSNRFLLRSHALMNTVSTWLGVLFDRLGLKSKLKKLIRFGRKT